MHMDKAPDGATNECIAYAEGGSILAERHKLENGVLHTKQSGFEYSSEL